jgi:hypothetical protein
MPIELYLQAIITVLSLVNPVMCGAIFQRIKINRSRLCGRPNMNISLGKRQLDSLFPALIVNGNV